MVSSNPTAQPRVNLHSDTATRPTPGMRKAIAEAEVGDEQAGEDPTAIRLQEKVAELLGKEAAVFLPSGTMCNEISYRVWCDHGDEIILEENSHALHYEVGGPGALAGVMTRTIKGTKGWFTSDQVEALIRPKSRHMPRQKLVSVENTANMAGGTIWPLDTLKGVADTARAHGMRMHMDGARLPNAVIASGISFADFAGTCDSAWIDLSKGLGCPIGGVLAGDRDFIEECWRFKHQFGGALRQSGIVAAAGIYALDHHLDRLGDDHARARRLAEGIEDVDGISVDPNSVETNMVFFDVSGSGIGAPEFSRRLMAEHEVKISAVQPTVLRAVTYLGIEDPEIELAVAAIRAVAAEA
ncbi:MAG: GntG family PLP-dependent aldolase [Thalassobaculaceae bacterium]|nr:GntG family PLP-dependent aldolase [Thalassobaculaceae bacterium]